MFLTCQLCSNIVEMERNIFFPLSRFLIHFFKARKVFCSQQICNICTLLPFLPQPLISFDTNLNNKNYKYFFLKNRISGKIQKNQMPVDRTCFTSISEEWDWKIILYLISTLTTIKKVRV